MIMKNLLETAITQASSVDEQSIDDIAQTLSMNGIPVSKEDAKIILDDGHDSRVAYGTVFPEYWRPPIKGYVISSKEEYQLDIQLQNDIVAGCSDPSAGIFEIRGAIRCTIRYTGEGKDFDAVKRSLDIITELYSIREQKTH